jgi:hypothetical protein
MANPDKKTSRKEMLKTSLKKKENLTAYIYDKKTRTWKMVNPSGSIAYNCLTRDEWSWLD